MNDNRNTNLWQNRSTEPRAFSVVDKMSLMAHKTGESMRKQLCVIMGRYGDPQIAALPGHLPYRR